jgi:hypothetical protein
MKPKRESGGIAPLILMSALYGVEREDLIFGKPCIVIYSYNKTNEMH